MVGMLLENFIEEIQIIVLPKKKNESKIAENRKIEKVLMSC
jgi:hypothetical protein